MQKGLLPKKNIWITRDAPLEFCWYKQFFIANTDIDCILIHDFYFFLTFLESLKNVFINMVTTLIMPAKIATLGLLKTKVFWNKGYGVIISVHNLINENFSSDSNYIVSYHNLNFICKNLARKNTFWGVFMVEVSIVWDW